MVICVPAEAEAEALKLLTENGEQAFVLGTIEETRDGQPQVQMND
jgi:phosphoribosylaminoimidazole (AIR) synthetase